MIKNKKIFMHIIYVAPGVSKTSIANAMTTELNLKTRT